MGYKNTIFVLDIYYVNYLSTFFMCNQNGRQMEWMIWWKTMQMNSLETGKCSDSFCWDCHIFQNQFFCLLGCPSDLHCLNTYNLLNYPLGSFHSMFSVQALFKQNCYTCVNKMRFSYKNLCCKIDFTVTEIKKNPIKDQQWALEDASLKGWNSPLKLSLNGTISEWWYA